MSSLHERLSDALADKYVIERPIGSGGMGHVFLAHDRKLDRQVAIKVLRPEIASPSATRRFVREAKTLARLSRPGIIPIHDADEVAGITYFVMDHVDGPTLEQRLRHGTLSTERAVQVGSEVLDALAAVHAQGIVHRDVKPSNIFLLGGRAMLADFGISKPLDGQATPLTEPEHSVGTPGYMAPEQLTGGEVGPHTDLYAVGMVLYEALTGRHWSLVADESGEDWAGVRAFVVPVLRRALAWSPQDRWPSASAFRSALCAAYGKAVAKRRKWRTIAGVVTTAVALLMTIMLSPFGGGDDTSPNLLLIFPFGVEAGEEFEDYSTMLPDLVRLILSGAGGLQVVDPNVVLGLLGGDKRISDPDRAWEIARQLGAGRFVLGELRDEGGQPVLEARLYGEGGAPLATTIGEASAGGTREAIDELVGRLADALLSPGNRPARLPPVADVTTASEAARLHWFRGVTYLRAGDYQAAVGAFNAALREDPSFALAYYGLAEAAGAAWLDPAIVQRSIGLAVEHSGTLPQPERELLEAIQAHRTGRYRQALDLYEDLITRRGADGDVRAWSELAEARFHYGPLYGEPLVDARAPFTTVLRLDPYHSFALYHLAVIAAVEGDTAALDSLYRKGQELTPSGISTPGMAALRVFKLGNQAEREEMLHMLRTVDDGRLGLAVGIACMYSGDLRGAEDVAELLTNLPRDPEVRAVGHVLRAHLLLARGKWREAWGQLLLAGERDRGVGLEYRALWSALPFPTVSSDSIRTIRQELAAWDPDSVPAPMSRFVFFRPHERMHRHLRYYLLGLLSAVSNEGGLALSYADSLSGLRPPPTASTLSSDLALGIRARVASRGPRRRDKLEARRLLESIQFKTWYQLTSVSPFHSRALERYTLANVLDELGDHEEALRWLGSFEYVSPYDFIFLAPSHLRRAEIHAELGNTEEAVRHYDRFIDLWKEADPELREWVEDARREREALKLGIGT